MKLEIKRRPLFSERLRSNKCRVCGPGLGMLCRPVPILGDEEREGFALVVCRACGGHSPAFVESTCDA